MACRLTTCCSHGRVITMVTRRASRLFRSVSGLPTPGMLLGVLLVADLAALVTVTVATLATVGLLGTGVDVTGLVAALLTTVADVLGAAGPAILGGWLLYTYLYLFVTLLVAALLCRGHLASAIWREAASLLSQVLIRIALSWCHTHPESPHFLTPADVLGQLAHERNADHLATGWRPEVHPALTYE